jgi:transcriptional regulator with XRE-family HTH domain
MPFFATILPIMSNYGILCTDIYERCGSMGFKENLQKYRESMGLTAKEFARLIGIKYNTYINYEGGTEPKYDTLCKIANALNVSIDDLLDYKIDRWKKTKSFLNEHGYILKQHKNKADDFSLTNEDGNTIPSVSKNELITCVENAEASASKAILQLTSSYLRVEFCGLILQKNGIPFGKKAPAE